MPIAMSFEQVYAQHFRFVWRCLRRLGVGESDVADAAQDVFLVVHRRLPDWQGRSKMTTWLFGICLRVASDRRKLAHVRREVTVSVLPDRRDDVLDPPDLLQQRDRLALLDAVLDELPMDQRAVFTLFELEELSGSEVAESLGIPIGTVWSRLRLAREAFRASVHRRASRQRFADVATGRSL